MSAAKVNLQRALIVCAIFAVLFIRVAKNHVFIWDSQVGLFHRLYSAIWAAFYALVAAAAYDFTTRGPISKSHTWFTAIALYSVQILSILAFKYAYAKLLVQSKDVKKAQVLHLLDIMQEKHDTEYGKKYNFQTVTSREEWVKRHPLTLYPHYKDYIDRTLAGELGVLFHEKPVYGGVTSSTSSGTSKIFPVTQKSISMFKWMLFPIWLGLTYIHRPKCRYLRKTLYLGFKPRFRYTENGVKLGPMSAIFLQNETTQTIMMTTPFVALGVKTEPEVIYLHALFGLMDKNIASIQTTFPPIVFSLGQCLETRWQELVEDVRLGRINPKLDIPEDIRWTLINEHMSPDPERARELEAEFRKGFHGIFRRIWPHVQVISCGTSGTFAVYAERLQAADGYATNIPFYSPGYGATEGFVGFNFERDSVVGEEKYTVLPSSSFFEFIRVENSDEAQPETLFLDEIKLGEEYEIAVTTLHGLYRYRFGDVVKVVGFMGQLPKLQFMYRVGQLLSVRGEKTSECAFFHALKKTVDQSWPGVTLKDYCCAESILLKGESESKTAPYYIIFLELLNQDGTAATLDESQIEMLDKNLSDESYPYFSFRRKDAIAAPHVSLVVPGTFDEFREYILEHSTASRVQMKIPRALRRTDYLDFMMSKVIN